MSDIEHLQAGGIAGRIVDRPTQNLSERVQQRLYDETHLALQAPATPAPPQIESRKPDPNPPGFGED